MSKVSGVFVPVLLREVKSALLSARRVGELTTWANIIYYLKGIIQRPT